MTQINQQVAYSDNWEQKRLANSDKCFLSMTVYRDKEGEWYELHKWRGNMSRILASWRYGSDGVVCHIHNDATIDMFGVSEFK